MSTDPEKRPEEKQAVFTTIVGGRPPGSGTDVGEIPRGIEVLVKKAAVDPEFRERLLAVRAGAADEIGLALEPAEKMMLEAVPTEQLEQIIAGTKVSPERKPAFLGKAAAVMLVALGASSLKCDCNPLTTRGVQPDKPGSEQPVTKGIRPDRVQPTDGIRPDRPDAEVPATQGVRPDEPAPKSEE